MIYIMLLINYSIHHQLVHPLTWVHFVQYNPILANQLLEIRMRFEMGNILINCQRDDARPERINLVRPVAILFNEKGKIASEARELKVSAEQQKPELDSAAVIDKINNERFALIGPDLSKLRMPGLSDAESIEHHVQKSEELKRAKNQPKNGKELEQLIAAHPDYHIDTLLSDDTLKKLPEICGSDKEACDIFLMKTAVFPRLKGSNRLLARLFKTVEDWHQAVSYVSSKGAFWQDDVYVPNMARLNAHLLTNKKHFERLVKSPSDLINLVRVFVKDNEPLVKEVFAKLMDNDPRFIAFVKRIPLGKLADKCLLSLRDPEASEAKAYRLLLDAALEKQEHFNAWFGQSPESYQNYYEHFNPSYGFPAEYCGKAQRLYRSIPSSSSTDEETKKLVATFGPDLDVLKKSSYEEHAANTRTIRNNFLKNRKGPLKPTDIVAHQKGHPQYHFDRIFPSKLVPEMYEVFKKFDALDCYYSFFLNHPRLATVIYNDEFLKAVVKSYYDWRELKHAFKEHSQHTRADLHRLFNHLLTTPDHFNRLINNKDDFLAFCRELKVQGEYSLVKVIHGLISDDILFKKVFTNWTLSSFFDSMKAHLGQDKDIYLVILEAVFNDPKRFNQWIGKNSESLKYFQDTYYNAWHVYKLPSYYWYNSKDKQAAPGNIFQFFAQYMPVNQTLTNNTESRAEFR